MSEIPVIYARLNWGNWIADCPIHGEGIAELVEPGKDFICSRCYPGIHAQMQMEHPQNPQVRVPVPDIMLRLRARQQAQQDGNIYRVIFPDEMEKILAIVRRRKVQHMNWRPGMTLADLRSENKEYGVI